MRQSRGNSFFGRCRSVEEYERLATLGEGAYGKVFQARDKKSQEIVALKRIKMTSENDGMPLTALREIQILKQVSHHQNIVSLKDIAVGPNLDSVFLVFEYCPHDLSCLLDRSGGLGKARFTESQIKNLLLQLLSSISFLHDRHIIHRDVKLSNLLYTNKGELKLADFGLSRYQNTYSRNMTPKVVTLWYRPPELLLGCREYDGYSVDVWACGSIFGELMLNKPLMPGKDEIGQFHEIVTLLGFPERDMWGYFEHLPKSNEILTSVRRSYVRHLNNHKDPKERKQEWLRKVPPNLGRVMSSLHDAPSQNLQERFSNCFSTKESYFLGLDLISRMLHLDPKKRITVREAMNHQYFKTVPLPANIMPTFKDQNYHRMYNL